MMLGSRVVLIVGQGVRMSFGKSAMAISGASMASRSYSSLNLAKPMMPLCPLYSGFASVGVKSKTHLLVQARNTTAGHAHGLKTKKVSGLAII